MARRSAAVGAEAHPMAVQTIHIDQFPRGTSRYTLALAKVLGSLRPGEEQAPNRNIVQALINLVQGRMLEYLADRICREYDIQDPVLATRIVSVLLGIFSDEFFALFRSTIEFQPGLVVQIARRILRKEGHAEPAQKYPSPMRQPADRLYPALFRKYFEYRNLGILLELVESDAQIQKIILRNVLNKQLGASPMHQRILQILEEDREGVAPSLLMGYLKGNDVSTLVDKVRSGAWEPELAALREHMAHLRGE
jgi:hypothetical protein